MQNTKVLFVDDEANILNAVTRLLRNEKYQTLIASSADEALSLMSREPVQVVIADQRMPEMTGIQFLERIKGLYPDTIRCILSGYSDFEATLQSINQGQVYRFLTKPWEGQALKDSIQECLTHYESVQQKKSLMEQIRCHNKELHDLMEEIALEQYISKEVISKIPIPLVTVNAKGRVLAINESGQKMFSSSRGFIFPGSAMADFLPFPVIEVIQFCFERAIPFQIPALPFNKRIVNLGIEPIRQGEVTEACLLTFESLEGRSSTKPAQNTP